MLDASLALRYRRRRGETAIIDCSRSPAAANQGSLRARCDRPNPSTICRIGLDTLGVRSSQRLQEVDRSRAGQQVVVVETSFQFGHVWHQPVSNPKVPEEEGSDG